MARTVTSTTGGAKERALRLLAVRSRSRAELARRLRMAGFDPAHAEEAIADLEAVGLVDDERLAQELATHEIERRGFGRRAALSSLRRLGIGSELAERSVGDALGTKDDEEARAEEVARARLRRLSGLAPEVAYRRLLGFLQRRGYDGETARAVCRRVLAQPADSI